MFISNFKNNINKSSRLSVESRSFPSEWSQILPSQVDTNSSVFRDYMKEFLSSDQNKNSFSNTSTVKFYVTPDDRSGILTVNYYTMSIPYSGIRQVDVEREIIGFRSLNLQTTISSVVESDGINASGSQIASFAPYEISSQLGTSGSNDIKTNVINFIYSKRNEIFNDLPSWESGQPYDYINLNDSYYQFVESTSTSITFKLTIKYIYVNGNVVSSWQDKAFTLKITGLTNKDTKIKQSAINPGITIDSSLSNYTQSDLVGATTSNSQQVQYGKLKNWLGSIYQTQIFENAPSNISAGTSGLAITAGPTEDSVYVSISSNPGCGYVNGKISTERTVYPDKVLIKGLRITGSTTLKSDSILATSDISQYSPYELASVIGTSSRDPQAAALKNFLQNNYTNMFDNLVTFPSSDNDFISFTGNTGEVVSTTPTSITFKFTVKSIYSDGTQIGNVNDNNWNTSLFKKFQITITGLSNKDTFINEPILSSGISASGNDIALLAPYEISSKLGTSGSNDIKTNVINFIYSKRNEIFSNLPSWEGGLPHDYINLNDSFYEFVESTSTSITFKLTVKKVYINGSYHTEWQDKVFTLKITGLTNKDTSTKSSILSSGISASGSDISQYSPYELASVIGTSSRDPQAAALKNFLQNNYTNMFDNLVTFPSSDNDFISFTGNTGEVVSTTPTSITFKFTVKSIYSDGTQIGNVNDNNWNTSLFKKFQITITGLVNKDTSKINNTWQANEFDINIPTRDLTNENLKNFINNTSDFRTKIFSNCPDDSIINSINITNRSGTSVTFNIVMSSVYKNGKISNSVEDCTFNDLVINGFSANATSIKDEIVSDGINADETLSSKAPYEVTTNDAKSFIYRKYQEIFNNPPSIFENQINITSISVINSTSISVNFTFPSYSDDGSSSTTDKPYTLVINGLTNKDTSMKSSILSSGISASGSELASLAPYEISSKLGTSGSNDIKTNVINFIYSKRNEIFNNLPSWSDGQPYDYINLNDSYYEFVESTSTSITFKFTVKKIYKNGQSDSSAWNDKEFTLKLIGLTDKDTSIKTNDSIHGSELSNKTVFEVDDNELKQYAIDHLISNKILNTNINNIDITNIKRDNSTGSISFNISINKSYISGSESLSWISPIFVTLNDFRILNETSTNNFDDGNNIFVGSSDVNSVTDEEIFNWFESNKSSIINNLPFGATSNMISIERDEKLGTIKINFSLDKYIDNNRELINSEKIFSITIGGFKKTNDSIIFYYVMLSIYVITSLLIIILIIMLLYKSVKKDKNIKKLNNLMPSKNSLSNNNSSLSLGKLPPPPKSNKNKKAKVRKVSATSSLNSSMTKIK